MAQYIDPVRKVVLIMTDRELLIKILSDTETEKNAIEGLRAEVDS